MTNPRVRPRKQIPGKRPEPGFFLVRSGPACMHGCPARSVLRPRRRYTKLVPRAAYTSLNDAFFDYANASGLPLPRRPSAGRAASTPDTHQLQLSTTTTTSGRSLGGANPRCRYFVSDELGMTTDDAKKQGAQPPPPPNPRGARESSPPRRPGFAYWIAVTCSCVYTYWGQSMGTMLPIAIWDFAGWTEEFWRIHRWPIKIICGTIYSLVQLLLLAKKEFMLERQLKRLDNFDAVIIDDIGYIQQSREEMEVLFTFLSERYERRSVVITSNWREIEL